MSRLGLNVSRNSRGSSRGIVYSNIMKNSNPTYGTSSSKKQSNYDGKLLKSQQPSTSSNYTKLSSFKDYSYNNYEQLLNGRDQRLQEKLNSESQLKRQIKDRNKDFRIRSNLKEKEVSSSLKGGKEDEFGEKNSKEQILKLYEQQVEKTTQQQNSKQSEKTITNTTSSSKYRNLKTIGLVGLNNIGNTCFMNSILQCVFNLPGFNEYFLDDQHVKELKSNSKVAQVYAKTIKMIRTSSSRSETPSELKNAIGSKKSRFLGYSQQDAQQFLAALLQLLSQDLNRSTKPKYRELTADTSKNTLEEISEEWWNYNKQREDSVVCDYFSGQILSRVVCSKCKHESIAFDNIWDMALNFSSGDGGKINRMIENFLKEETIASDYYCGKCKSFRECKRKIDFYRLPKILVFQIKRFSYGRWRKVKLNNYIKIQSTLDLSPFIKQSNHKSVKNPVYNLVGMVNHSGDIDFGHYTAECKNPINNKWYNFNDSHVSETRMRESFESSSPYLLFYAKDE